MNAEKKEKLITKYCAMDLHDRSQFFENAVKKSNYAIVKLFLETDKISIFNKSIEYGLFYSCINNDLRMFKYLMFKQKRMNLDLPNYWIKSLADSCTQEEQKVLNFIVKTPLKNLEFTQDDFDNAFMKTHRSVNSIKYLIENKLVNVNEVIYKNHSEYLKKIVEYSRIEEMQYLAENHYVLFVEFKDLAQSVKAQHRGDQTLDIIQKQNSHEMFLSMGKELKSKPKAKGLKL